MECNVQQNIDLSDIIAVIKIAVIQFNMPPTTFPCLQRHRVVYLVLTTHQIAMSFLTDSDTDSQCPTCILSTNKPFKSSTDDHVSQQTVTVGIQTFR